MWWCNILGGIEGSISYLLWYDPIPPGSDLLTSNLIFMIRENPDPILTVKRIEWKNSLVILV